MYETAAACAFAVPIRKAPSIALKWSRRLSQLPQVWWKRRKGRQQLKGRRNRSASGALSVTRAFVAPFEVSSLFQRILEEPALAMSKSIWPLRFIIRNKQVGVTVN